ncbi:hypothetical protein CAPTEDRAFT_191487 [Capitella teleta]|uniref:Uncharacterized protein n=1 Tax=Capitella teleta TaxID=283909 RepID=R7U1R7_CAPTE|nr:hypothetical protein CAPTEDRAFT_191487 [Capitella teleta]|eukprot:ELU00174.1 hypothetical protein CAPTEDRAFT_191487 [Capitella teleta]
MAATDNSVNEIDAEMEKQEENWGIVDLYRVDLVVVFRFDVNLLHLVLGNGTVVLNDYWNSRNVLYIWNVPGGLLRVLGSWRGNRKVNIMRCTLPCAHIRLGTISTRTWTNIVSRNVLWKKSAPGQY